jgi:phage FluMu protein Com
MDSSQAENQTLLERAECPICRKLLFKVKPGAVAVIEIKCDGCQRFVILTFGPLQFPIAVLQRPVVDSG